MHRWLGLLLVLLSCQRAGEPQAPDPETWLHGGTDERFAAVSRQLRGFDAAMVEVGYRYAELYWAGQDQNWEYAAYQIDKIRTAVELGLERRPKRAGSAAVLESALGPLSEAVQRRDPAEFERRFDQLTLSCNACHRAELVPFMHVVTPAERRSSIRAPREQP